VTPRCAYSVVVPCFCSGPWLAELVERVGRAMAALGEPFELLLVNDASPDGTWRVIEDACARHPFVRGYDLLANAGQFRATICGLEHARGEVIVTMDDDLQHRPEDIPILARALAAAPDVDCVVAAYRRKRHGPLRNLGSALYHRMEVALYGGRPGLRMTSFRAMRRPVALAICAHRTARPVMAPLLLSSTGRIANVEVEHQARPQGRTGYSLARLVGIVRDTVIAGSVAPLRLVSMIGFAAAAVSAGLALWYLTRFLMGKIRVAGFVTQVLLITFFGGLTLLSIGLLGEYVVRILAEVSRPPRYQLRRVAGSDGAV
jgi:dolichol-phosphate mannosyltransferase/undecaprenyl-phosphate 4-deoxy-4-formamido-L-arabinose transferase